MHKYMHIWIRVYIDMYTMNTCIHRYVYMYIYICTDMSRYVYMCVYIYVYIYDSFHMKCNIPQIHLIEKLQFLNISQFLLNLNLCLYRGICVAGFGGFLGCSILSGYYHKCTDIYTYDYVCIYICVYIYI